MQKIFFFLFLLGCAQPDVAQSKLDAKQMGFKKVFDYSGGMSDWQAKGKKTVH